MNYNHLKAANSQDFILINRLFHLAIGLLDTEITNASAAANRAGNYSALLLQRLQGTHNTLWQVAILTRSRYEQILLEVCFDER